MTATCARALATSCAPATRRPGSTAWAASCCSPARSAAVPAPAPSGTSRWFVDAQAAWRRERLDVWLENRRIEEYRLGRTRLELTAGVNLGLLGQLCAGRRETQLDATMETGLGQLGLPQRRSSGGWVVALELDRLDQLYFPCRGWSLRLGH